MKKLEREGLDFEKWLITLATGTLVLSVSFLQSRSVDGNEQTLLVGAWIALVASIFAGLLDRLLYIFSLSSHPALREGEEDDHGIAEQRWLRYWSWSERMSWLQILAFFIGILALLIFAIVSLT